MSKSRKRKKTASKAKRRKKKQKISVIKPYEPVKYDVISMPDIFGDMPLEKRREVLRKLAKESKGVFNETYAQMSDLFATYDALYLLSFCSTYFLSAPEGTDPEAIEGKLDFYQHNLELFQALSLTKERCISSDYLNDEKIHNLKELAKSFEHSIFFRQFYSDKPLSEEELKKRSALAEIRGQTTAVRNPYYPQQTFQIARKLYSETSILENYNLEVNKILDFLWGLMIKTEEKLNVHLNKVRSFVMPKNLSLKETWKLYKKAFPAEENNEEMFTAFAELVKGNEKNFKYYLAAYTDLRLPNVYAFSLDEALQLYGDDSKKEELKQILDLWSYSFGDLKSYKVEHFILDNPILKRPFIKLDKETYFCPVMGTINHSLLDLMELLIINLNSKTEMEKYEKARGKLLEDEVEQLFRDYFPNAKIFKGSLWNDLKNGRNGENDLLIILDTFAFVVECKAGKVNASARRGSVLKLKKVLKDLVVKASKQTNNFITFLSDNKKVLQLSTVSTQDNVIDNINIRYYVPITVTLESLGTVSANLRSCAEVGWIDTQTTDLVPSIPVGDLEVIFQLLENEVERTHYLIRRSQIERSLKYRGDELDLLAFYLDTGFNLGSDKKEFPFINFNIKSKELDPYFVGKARGIKVTKPKLNLSTWWKDIIELICKRKPNNWVEMGYILLNTPKKAQNEFKERFHQLSKRIREKKVDYPINFALMTIENEEHSYAISIYPFEETDKSERDNTIRRIIEEVDTNYSALGIVCFGIAIDNPKYPYNVSAYFPKDLLG